MRKLHREFIGAVALLAACTTGGATQVDRSPIATYWPHVPALAELESVRLGMQYSRLRQARQNVRPAPYVGAAEVVEGDSVRFHFRSNEFAHDSRIGGLFHDAPSDASVLLGVESWATLANDADAEALWSDRVKYLERAHPGRVECFTYEQGGINRAAILPDSHVVLGVLLYPERTLYDVRGPGIIFPIVRTFVSSELDLFINNSARHAVGCG